MRLSIQSLFIIAECLRTGLIEGYGWKELSREATAGDVLLQTLNISSIAVPSVSEISTIDELLYLNITLDETLVYLNSTSFQRPSYFNETILEAAEVTDAVFPDLRLNWSDFVRCMADLAGCWRGMWECSSDVWWRDRTYPCNVRGPGFPDYDPHYAECYSDYHWREHNCKCEEHGSLYPDLPGFKHCTPTVTAREFQQFPPKPTTHFPRSLPVTAANDGSLGLRDIFVVAINRLKYVDSLPALDFKPASSIFDERKE